MSNLTVEIHPTLAGIAKCFPLARLAKTPAVKWKEYDQSLPHGTSGYGVDCDRSGFVVIDLDTHDETANGLTAWQKLLKDHGGEFGDTFTVATANGGLHLYYLRPDGVTVKNSASKLAPGIDVRGKGGYVVGPNSTIKTTDGLEATYEVVRDEVIRELPEWLLGLLVEDKKSQLLPAYEPTDDFPDNYARKALESAYYTVSTAPSGQRNETLNREAFGAAKAGAPVERVINDLTRAALANGLSRREIDTTVERAAREGAGNYVPRVRTDPTTGAMIATPDGRMEFQQFTKEYYLDLPLGERWAASKKGKLVYVMEASQWRRYEEEQGIWVEVRESSVREDAAHWLKKEYNTAALRNKDSITRHAERCLNKTTADNTIYMGKLDLLLSSAQLDQHKDLLVVSNGVLDLRTGTLGAFDQSLYVTKRIAYPYQPAVQSKYWSKVLEALPADAHDWLQVMTGQTLTGHQSASDVCLFLFGGGSNGKSTFLDILAESAGTYGDEPPQSSLMRKTGHGEDFGLISFKGIRQALVEELPDERNLDVKAVKKLVGTKNLTARGMYRDYETFEVQATLWVSCNRLPNVSETDHGTWRRLLVVPFPFTYKLTKAEITEAHHVLADLEVKKSASTDADTIAACLAWRVEGARRWYANRDFESAVPASVREASAVWRKRSDHVLAFTDEILVADPNSFVLSSDLHDAFNLWLRNNGYSTWGAKLFLERFETSEFYSRNKLLYNAKSTVAKTITQSKWTAPDGTEKTAGKQPAHVLGVRFRNAADDDREIAAALSSLTVPNDTSSLDCDGLDLSNDSELFEDESVF